MYRVISPLVTLSVLLTFAGPVWANPELARGIKLLKNMEDAQAIEAFKKALNWADNTSKIRGQIYIHLGIAQSNQLKRDPAIESFRRALVEDPEIDLPERTSPKIRELFDRARVEIEKERTPLKPPTTAPVKPPVAQPAPPPAPQQPSLFRRYRSAWIALGVAVGAASTGLALGVLSRRDEDKAADDSLTYDEAKKHHDRAKNRALGANIMFGLAGAGAVATGVLFYLGSRSGERPRTTAAFAPSQGGLVAQVRSEW
jgi:tetratricopeptide (TPR) repeat protein